MEISAQGASMKRRSAGKGCPSSGGVPADLAPAAGVPGHLRPAGSSAGRPGKANMATAIRRCLWQHIISGSPVLDYSSHCSISIWFGLVNITVDQVCLLYSPHHLFHRGQKAANSLCEKVLQLEGRPCVAIAIDETADELHQFA